MRGIYNPSHRGEYMFLTSILQKSTGPKLKYILEIALAKRGVNLGWDNIGKKFTKEDYGDIYTVYSWLYAGVISLNMAQILNYTKGMITVDSLLNMLQDDWFVMEKRELLKGEVEAKSENLYPFNPDDGFEVTDEVIQIIREDMGDIIYRNIKGESLYVIYAETFPIRAVFMYYIKERSNEKDYVQVQSKVNAVLELFPKYLPSYSEAQDNNMIGLINTHLRQFLSRKPDIQKIINGEVKTKVVKGGNVLDLEKERKLKFYDAREKEEYKDVIPDIINIFDLSKMFLNYTTQANDSGISTTLIEVTLDKQLSEAIEQLYSIVASPSGRKYSFEKNSILGTSRVVKDTARKNEMEALKLIDKAMSAYVGIDSPEILSAYNRMNSKPLDIIKDISISKQARAKAPANIPDSLKDRVCGNIVAKADDTAAIYIRDFLNKDFESRGTVYANGKELSNYYLRIPMLKGAKDFMALCKGVNAIRNLQKDLKSMPNVSLSDCIITSESELNKLKKAGSLQNYLFSNNFELDRSIFGDKYLAEEIQIDLGNKSKDYNGNIREVLLSSRIQEAHIDYSDIHLTDPNMKSKEILIKRQAPGKVYSTMWLSMFPQYYDTDIEPSERIKRITPTANVEFLDRVYSAKDCDLYIDRITRKSSERDFTGAMWQDTVLNAKKRIVTDKIFIGDISATDYTPFRVVESLSYMNFVNDIGAYELLKEVIDDVIIPITFCNNSVYACIGAYLVKDMIETGYILDESILNQLSSMELTQDSLKNLNLMKVKNMSIVAKTIRSLITCKNTVDIYSYCKKLGESMERYSGRLVVKYTARRKSLSVNVMTNKINKIKSTFQRIRSQLTAESVGSVLNESLNLSYLYDLFLNLYGELFWSLRNIGYDVVSLGNAPTSNDNTQEYIDELTLMHNLYLAHRSTLIKTIIAKFKQIKDAYALQPDAHMYATYNSLEYKLLKICEILNLDAKTTKSYVDKAKQIGNDKQFEVKLQKLCNLISVDNIQYLDNYYAYVFEHSNNQLRTTLGLHPELKQSTVNTEELVSKARDVLSLQSSFIQPSLAYCDAMKETPLYRDKEFDSNGFAVKDGKMIVWEKNDRYYVLRKEGYLLCYDGNEVKPVDAISSVVVKSFDENGREKIEDIDYTEDCKLLDSNDKTYLAKGKVDDYIIKIGLINGRIQYKERQLLELSEKAALIQKSDADLIGLDAPIEISQDGQFVLAETRNDSYSLVKSKIDDLSADISSDKMQLMKINQNLKEVVGITITKVL